MCSFLIIHGKETSTQELLLEHHRPTHLVKYLVLLKATPNKSHRHNDILCTKEIPESILLSYATLFNVN